MISLSPRDDFVLVGRKEDSRQVGSSSDEVGPGGGALVTLERGGYGCWSTAVAAAGMRSGEAARLATGREDEDETAADATARFTI